MSFFSLFRSFALILTILEIVKSGRILNGDLWVDYANAGSMTQLSFSFMLENPLDQFDYIKASLPFPLHSSLVPAYPAKQGLSLPNGLQVTYQQVDQSSNIQPTIKTCQALTQTIDSSKYFIRFYDTDRKTLLPIPNNQWFYLKFKLKDRSPLEYQKSNSILQVQLSTVSSVWSNAMVYDDNLAFSYFELASAPSQGITLKTTPYDYGSAGGYLLTQEQYDLYLDVTMNIPTYQFQENLKLLFFIGEQIQATDNFKFSGSCSSVAKTNSPTIDLLDPSLYTCQIDTVNNIMEVILTPQALQTQVSYRFTVQIINPSIVLKDVDIKVKAVKEVSGVILSYGIDQAALSTNQIYITYQQIFLGWGLRPDALLPFDARIFRSDSATPTYMPYNSLSTKFSISQTTSSDIQLKIQINIPSESTAHVLQNGYTHNLPSFTDKQVRCVVQYADDTIKRKIACTGVGSLAVGQVYEIGWKMYFPYDNYESSIDCTQFGLITIYTGQTITSQDNAYILGRGDQFLEFLKASPDYFVIGRNTSYITYMKTFANLNLIVLSSDFQDFLKIPEQIIITNRPATFTDKKFNDVYVVGQNLAFMTYLELFDDLYIAYKLKSDTDILKSYDSTPIVATSMPKNTLTIKTSNSKNWAGFSVNSNPLISSTQTLDFTVGTSLEVVPSTDQTLVFSLDAAYSQVSSVPSSDALVQDKWGMLIMFNPKIKANNPTVDLYQDPSTTLSVQGITVDDNAAYNKYSLITLKANTPGQIQTSFPTVASKKSFGVQPFRIQDFSSIYADEDNFDFMIATIDGIDGPLNRITYNGFFLINGFSLTPVADQITPSIQTSFVAYDVNNPMDGSKIPTLFRVKGQISGTTDFNTLNLFFDKLTPFFENYHNRDIFCKSTDGTPYCKFYKGAEAVLANQQQNYMTYSRIQIPLTNPSNPFDIVIPVIHQSGHTYPKLHIGYTQKDAATGRIFNRYIETIKIFSQTGSPSTSGTFGPDLTGLSLGQTVSNMVLNSNSAGITQNTASSWGAAFLYFSQWDYFHGVGPNSPFTQPCYMMDYLLYQTNYEDFIDTSATFAYTYKNMKGVVCFCDTSAATSGSSLTFGTGYLPAKYGLFIPGWGGYSQSSGQLIRLNGNSDSFSAALQLTDPIQTPTMGPLLAKSVGQWVIPLPVALTDNVQIIMTGVSSVNLPFTSSTGTCSINVNDIKTSIGCIYTSSLTEMDYILTIRQRDLLPAGTDLQIMHHGLTTNSSYSTIQFNLEVFSLVNTNAPGANDLIFFKNTINFNYGTDDTSYIGQSQLILSSYHQITNNKAAITAFNFSFTILSKGIYLTNRVRIDLGQYQIDNTASQISPKCKIYQYTVDGSLQYSHDWAGIDTSRGFDYLQFWPQKNLLSENLTYTVKCFNFLAASTSSPSPITAMIVNTSSDLTGQLSTTSDLTLSTLPSLTKSNQVSATKKFTIPSTLMEIQFTITSPGIDTDSIIYIGFPSYYANGLGPDLKCYSSSQIYCIVLNDRELMIRYVGTFSEGTQFIIQVTGVSQPVNYNSGTFYFVIDDNDDRESVLSSGTFIDSVSTSVLSTQNFPAFQILSFSQSSNYLREQGISLSMEFYIPSTLQTVSVGQYLFMVFPPNFGEVLRFMQPICTLNIRGNSLKNYISSCEVKGSRIRMPFLDDLVLGSVYSLNIQGIINPTNPSSNVYKYSLEITSTSGTSIIAKSFSPHANFQMPIFIANPIRNNLNYYTVDDGLITKITTTINIQSKQLFISPDSDLTTSSYSRNVYLEPFNNLYSQPSKISLLSGQNPFPIRLSGLTSGVNYIFFQKSGDGNYYSSLPPLTLLVNKKYDSEVTFVQTDFSLPVAAVNTNYTVAVNLPEEIYPMTEVAFQVTLSSNSVGLSLRQSPTIISFYPDKTTATIKLYINDATQWISGTTCDLIITPQDTNTFILPATIPVLATSSSSSKPSLSLSLQSVNLKDATFSITCSRYGRFVYHISRSFSYNTSACTLQTNQIANWIQQTSIDGLRVDQTYYECEDILGTVNVVTPGTPQSLVIQNIKSSTKYTIHGYCLSQLGLKSDDQKKYFTTTSNGGYVSKMNFYFSETLTPAQKIKLVCALALKFEINYQKVSTADGYYCSQLLNSRRLLLKNSNAHRILTTSNHRVEVYFGVNTQLNSDTSASTIYSESITQTAIQQSLQDVVGLPNLISMSVSEPSYVGTNSLNTDYFLDIGPDYLYIQGMKMSNNGIIYVIVGQESLWDRDPVISQIKKGSGPNGLPPVFYKVMPYNKNQPQTSYVSYTGMPNQKLFLYILVSDDNPFDTANFGKIQKHEILAQVPTWEKNLLVIASAIMLFMLLW